MEKSYCIHDMVIDSICFCQVKKNHFNWSNNGLSKSKIWRLSIPKYMTGSSYATSQVSCNCWFIVAYAECSVLHVRLSFAIRMIQEHCICLCFDFSSLRNDMKLSLYLPTCAELYCHETFSCSHLCCQFPWVKNHQVYMCWFRSWLMMNLFFHSFILQDAGLLFCLILCIHCVSFLYRSIVAAFKVSLYYQLLIFLEVHLSFVVVAVSVI